MNINDYRRAMDRITPNEQLKERIMDQKNIRKHTTARRAVNVLLAAALTAACLFTAAFAANPEFRTAVLSFFRMEQREQLPTPSGSAGTDGPDISNAEIGELVKAQYIKMDSYRYGYSAGLLNNLTWSEDWKTLLDAKFWEVRDNELIPVEVDMQTGKVDITHNGIHYQGEFWWFVHEGKLDFFTGDNRAHSEDGENQWDWNFSYVSGRTDVLLLRLSTGTQMEYVEYPLLYHLDTGETEELFTGIDPDILAESDGAVWSDNFRLALLTDHASAEFPYGHEWLYDRETQTLTDVSTLGGIGADQATFADDDTLILYDMTISEDGDAQAVTVYSYDITSGRSVKTLEQTPYYRSWEDNPSGVQVCGAHCVLISADGQVRAIDLKTGAQTILEGFTCRPEDSLLFNPSGTKLLYFAMDSEAPGLGISQIGVADLEKGIFFAFDREGYENLYEGGIGWDGDDTMSIRASTLDDETHYLLLYQF